MKNNNLIFLIIGCFLCVNSVFAYSGHVYVTIINNSNSDYYYDNSVKFNPPGGTLETSLSALAGQTTKNAFVAECTSYIGYPIPSGIFSYKNQINGNTCSFKFGSLGVTPLDDLNKSCTVINTSASYGSLDATIMIS